MKLHFRGIGTRRIPAIGALAIGVGLLVGPSANATLSTDMSSFDAGDGDMSVTARGDHDWADFVGHATEGYKIPNTGITFQASVADEHKGSANADSSFVNGTKEDDSPPTVGTGGIPPNKDDFTHLYVASEHAQTAASDSKYHDFVYMGWARTNNPGTAFESFEFNQSHKISTNGATPERTAGDVLVLYDVASGAAKPSISVALWVKPGSGCDNTKDNGLATGCWAKRTAASAIGAEALTNAASFADPLGNGMLQPANTFGEAALDMQAASIFTTGSCKTFGYAMLASRSSSSVDATMKDYAGPAPVNITNCGSASFTKTDDAGHPLNEAVYNVYTDGDVAGTFDETAADLYQPTTIVDTAAAIDSASVTVADAGAFPSDGKFSVTVGSSAALAVASVSGNVLTLAAGTSHAAFAKGDTVTWTGTCSPYSPDATDSTKPAVCTIGDLSNGLYWVREASAPFGYVLDQTPWKVAVTDAVKTFTHPFTDGRAPVRIFVEKQDDATPAVGISICGSTIPTPPNCAAFALFASATPTSTIATAAAAGAASLAVANGGAFPASGSFNVWVEQELLTVSSRSGNVLTLSGPDTSAHAAAVSVTQMVATSKACASTGTTGECKFEGVVPGTYFVTESTTPNGYATSPPRKVVIALGDTDKTLNMTDPRLFKVVTLICTKSNNHLKSGSVTYDGSSTTGTAPASGGTSLTLDQEEAVCGLTGSYVLDGVQKNDSARPHTSSIVIP